MSLVKKRSIVNLLKSRRSIRIFKPISIPDEVVRLLVEVGVRAPTPSHLQLYSLIWVRSPEKREKLSEICQEEIVKNASIILLVCGDLRRAAKMLDLLEHRHVLSSDKHPVETVMSIFEAALVVDSITITAESLGLGSVILDCPLLYAPIIGRLFNLPRGVVPLALVCIGVRGESPPLRPRLPLEIILHEDSYRELAEDELRAFLSKLEKHMEMENYVKKYTGKSIKYLDYLRMRTELSKDAEKDYDALIKYLKENFYKI
ncbi:MAG: nitroreductase family protein [Candidatus Caldarchaeales archaeon]